MLKYTLCIFMSFFLPDLLCLHGYEYEYIILFVNVEIFFFHEKSRPSRICILSIFQNWLNIHLDDNI